MASLPDSARAVLESAALAHLVTLNPDGSPQVTVVWVGLDGDEIVAGHLPEHRKVRNIRNDSRVALSIETDKRNAMGLNEYLVIYGTARITEGGAAELLQRLAPQLSWSRRPLSAHGQPTARIYHSHHGGSGLRCGPLGTELTAACTGQRVGHLAGRVARIGWGRRTAKRCREVSDAAGPDHLAGRVSRYGAGFALPAGGQDGELLALSPSNAGHAA